MRAALAAQKAIRQPVVLLGRSRFVLLRGKGAVWRHTVKIDDHQIQNPAYSTAQSMIRKNETIYCRQLGVMT